MIYNTVLWLAVYCHVSEIPCPDWLVTHRNIAVLVPCVQVWRGILLSDRLPGVAGKVRI